MSNEKSVVVLSVLVIFIWKESAESILADVISFIVTVLEKDTAAEIKKTGEAGTGPSSNGG